MWSHQVTGSTRQVATGSWGKSVSWCRVVRAVVFTRLRLHCPSAATLFCQQLPQQGGAIQFWILPSVTWDQLWDPPPAQLWEFGLSPPFLLSAFVPLLTSVGCSSSGEVGLSPTTALSLCCFSLVYSLRAQHWELGTGPTPVFWGRFSVPPPPPLSVIHYSSLLMLSSFVEVGFSLPRGYSGSCSWEVGRGVACVMWCSPVCPADSGKQLLHQLLGRNGAV
jgi:hypothetical protein